MRRNSFCKTTGLITVFAASILLAACQSTPAPTVKAVYDRATDFSDYRTFSITQTPEITVYGDKAPVARAFAAAIDREMSAEGYRHVETGGDLYINYRVEIDNDIEAFNNAVPITPDRTGYYRSWSSLYGPLPQEREGGTTRITYTGAANIDIVDSARKQAVWQGVYQRKLNKLDEDQPDEMIGKAVQELLSSFPPK